MMTLAFDPFFRDLNRLTEMFGSARAPHHGNGRLPGRR